MPEPTFSFTFNAYDKRKGTIVATSTQTLSERFAKTGAADFLNATSGATLVKVIRSGAEFWEVVRH